ncbi:hypothetical protein M9R85_05155 [Psychrobacillus psychrodurans]|nr:hypothetical protein [Psychrobacillus psychrodurans]
MGFFSNKYNKQDVQKITTPFVYEVSSDWGIEFSEEMFIRLPEKKWCE